MQNIETQRVIETAKFAIDRTQHTKTITTINNIYMRIVQRIQRKNRIKVTNNNTQMEN